VLVACAAWFNFLPAAMRPFTSLRLTPVMIHGSSHQVVYCKGRALRQATTKAPARAAEPKFTC
jgi:hypothetical protein